MKKYIAKTSVSVNVTLGTGANLHLTFTSLTGGGSVYYTDNEEIQKALERHYKYGKLFTAAEELPIAEEPSAEDAGEDKENGIKVKVVSDLEEARNWLCEAYGLSRTKLRKEDSIKATALQYGIKLEGI